MCIRDRPGLTVNYEGGSYGAASDPSVAYDAKHGQWLISSLPLAGLNPDSEYTVSYTHLDVYKRQQ